MRELLRSGDVTGAATSSDPAFIVEAIRSPAAMVLVAINTRNSGGIDDLTCAVPTTSPHWRVDAAAPDVWLDVPSDLAIADAFEIRDGAVLDLPAGATVTGRRIKLPALAVDAARPTRLIVFAGSAQLRGQVVSSL